MDCEKFDLHVIDELYDELDELTHAALKRHVDGCSRCASILSGLRATREVGILPLEDPSDGLESKIFEAVAQKKTPIHRKLLRGITWAGSQAMRPQLAMAALFFLVIGSSLLLLRAKPSAPLRVTERGSPTPDSEVMAESAAAPAATAAASAAPMAFAEPPDGRDSKSKEGKEKGANRTEANAALADARAVRERSGCGAAVSKFDEVGARFPATSAAADAMWEAASCYRTMGEGTKARELLLALRSNANYRERAEQELAAQETNLGNAQQQHVAARPAARHAAPAPPPPPAAAPPAAMAQRVPQESPAASAAPAATANPADNQSGSSGKAMSAPKKAASPVRDAL